MLDACSCQAESYPNAESYRNEEVERWGRQGEGRVGVDKVKAGSAIEISSGGRGRAEVPQEGTLGGKGQAERGQEGGAGGGES